MKTRIAALGTAAALAVAGGVAFAQQVPPQFVVSGKAAEKIMDYTTINLATAERIAEVCEREAAKEGVADKAKFVQGDMFTADISQATVMALFLLPDNLRKLNQKFLDLRPGTRIVVNTFGIDGWEPAQSESATGDCGAWCSVILYIVPAKVAGNWRLSDGTLALEQKVQQITGTLTLGGVARPIENGRVTGEQISFTVGGVEYTGQLKGDTIAGTVKSNVPGNWTATRQ